MNDRITIEIDAGVADVRLARPDKRNALDGPMFDALIDAGRALQDTRGLRAVVLSGLGRGFCAGIDMEVLADVQGGAIAGTRNLRERTHGLCNRFQYAAWVWHELPVPVIAAVHGFALGGGLELALGADLRYVTADTRMAVMEVTWGLVPDMGGTVRMHDLARDDVVRELAFTGRVFSGTQALAYGFATRVEAEPHAAALDTAREIAAKSPDAVRAGKRLFNQATRERTAAGLLAEAVEQEKLLGTANQWETVRAGREGRAPKFDD